MKQPTVALLTNAPAPYRVPFFNELAKRVELHVFFDTLRESSREWDVEPDEFAFAWTEISGVGIRRARTQTGFEEARVTHVPFSLVQSLRRLAPDVVVSAELGVRTASAAAYCRTRRVPLIAWWEGIRATETKRAAPRHAFRRTLLRACSRVWCNGVGSLESLRDYGVAPTSIDQGLIGIDTAGWFDRVEAARPCFGLKRSELGLSGAVVLFCGSLTPRKGVAELLSALDLIVQTGGCPPWSLLVVGSGPESERIDRWSRLHPGVPVVQTGFVQPQDLAAVFALADLFVMPSLEDCWGVVSLESRVAGVPQVTSALVGAAADVVTDTSVGAIADPRDPNEFAAEIQARLSTTARVPSSARAVAVRKWSPESCADRAHRSIERALMDGGINAA